VSGTGCEAFLAASIVDPHLGAGIGHILMTDQVRTIHLDLSGPLLESLTGKR
jgi:hypothetical protein